MIRAIVTDMDETFLNQDGNYDHQKFQVINRLMKEKDIQFIVNSGNQYYQLISFFPGNEKNFVFISENGAMSVIEGKTFQIHSISPKEIKALLSFFKSQHLWKDLLLCGVSSAYLLNEANQEMKTHYSRYYYQLKELKSFSTLPEDIFLRLSIREDRLNRETFDQAFEEAFKGKYRAVYSGDGHIGIIRKNINKGRALKEVLNHLGIKKEETIAFGDGENDVEMLQLVGKAYVVENGSPQAKEIATSIIPSNEKSGVLTTLETLLK